MPAQPDWRTNLIQLLKGKQSGMRLDPRPDHRPFTLDNLARRIQINLGYDVEAEFRSIANSLPLEIREQCAEGMARMRREAGHTLAILNAMTVEERKSPSILTESRLRRIARGSGVEPEEVDALIRCFELMRECNNRLATEDSLNWLIDRRWDQVADDFASQ